MCEEEDRENKRIQKAMEVEEARGRVTYDKSNKRLDMGNLRATDYKYNKHVQLLKPKDAYNEAKHELRRTEHMKTLINKCPVYHQGKN